MRPFAIILASALGLGVAAPTASADDENEAKINFNDHVSEVFRSRCNTCHNADAQKGGLNLTTYATMMQGGGSGPVIEPGDPDNSWLYLLVSHQETPKMPPNSPPIPDEELQTIRTWIELGAPESAGSKVDLPDKPKMELTIDPEAIGKPSGEPAMPQGVPTEPVIVSERPGAVLALAASPWAPLLAIGQHQQVLLYRTTDARLVGVLPFPEGDVTVLRFTRDGDLLLAGGGRSGQSGRVVVWDVKTGERVIEVGDEYDLVLAADISPDRSMVALGGPSKVLRVYGTADNSLLYEQSKHTEWVTACAFSPDGVLLASADRNGGLHVWEAHSGAEFYNLGGHQQMVTALDWRLDSNVLASASEDRSVKLWDMFKGNQIKSWNAHGGGTLSVRFAKDGRLATAGRDRRAKLWDQNGKELRSFPNFDDLALQATLGHEDQSVFAGSFDGRVRMFNAEEGQTLADFRANPRPVAERLAEVRGQLEAARAKVAEAEAALEPFRNAVQTADQTLAEAVKQREQAEAQNTEAKNALKTAQAAANEANNAYDAARGAFQDALHADQRAVEALNAAAQAVAQRAEQLRKVAEAASETSEAASVQTAAAEHSQATEAVVPALAEVIAAADALQTHRVRLAEAKAKQTEAQTALQAAQAAAKAAEAQLADRQKAVEQAEAQKAAAETKLAEQTPPLKAAQTEVAEIQSHMQDLAAELEAAAAETAASASASASTESE